MNIDNFTPGQLFRGGMILNALGWVVIFLVGWGTAAFVHWVFV